MRIRSLRPDKHVHQDWRGGQITQIAGGTTTIKLMAEANMVRTKTCATSLVPVDAQSVRCPVACRVTGTGADDYVIVEVIGSSFGANGAPRSGDWAPGIIPRSITLEPLTYWEAWTD
jgi:hypothetical protein